MRKEWQSNDYIMTLKKVVSGEYKMTVWACNQQFRRKHHLKLKRLRQIYNEGAHAAVKNAVHGEANVGGLRRLGREAAADDARDLPATEGDRAELRGEELKKAIAAEKLREKEYASQDKAALNELYEPGTWRCSRCHGILAPSVTECPKLDASPRTPRNTGEIWKCHVPTLQGLADRDMGRICSRIGLEASARA
jgi:hypothetical protein